MRAYLARAGFRENDLAVFVEDAVRWRIFERSQDEARQAFADLPPAEVEVLIDEALADARAGLCAEGRLKAFGPAGS